MTRKVLHGKLNLEVFVTTCKDPGNLVNAHYDPPPMSCLPFGTLPCLVRISCRPQHCASRRAFSVRHSCYATPLQLGKYKSYCQYTHKYNFIRTAMSKLWKRGNKSRFLKHTIEIFRSQPKMTPCITVLL